MFGILKRKGEPMGPFEFEHSIEIARPAAEVYAMVDWADPRNAKRALGNNVEHVGSAPDRFRLHLDLVPGHTFEMIVTEAVPGQRYGFENEITPPVGRLVASQETYWVEPIDEASCRLNLAISATFVGGMSDQEIAMEVMMMGMSGQNALAKLQIQAEQGVDAVHAIEACQMADYDEDMED